jgi:hypothetical protein
MRGGFKRKAVWIAAAAAAAAVAIPGAAYGSPPTTAGTATINAGPGVSVTPPTTVGFTATLSGADQTVNANQLLDIIDGGDTGAGWTVTLSATTFKTAGSLALPATSLTDGVAGGANGVGPTGACDSSALTCTLAQSSMVYPVSVTTADTAPTAVQIQSANAGTGSGNQTWTHSMHLFLPGTTRAGTYNSTWTYSVTAAP